MTVRDVLAQTQLERVGDGEIVDVLPAEGRAQPLLMLIWPQLGDFDSLEYAWWLQKEKDTLADLNVTVRAIGIGDRASGQKFCEFTGFNPTHLFVDPAAKLHQTLGLYEGLGMKVPAASSSTNAYLNLLLMCAGIGSPGTLKEVFRGYLGDRQAPQLIEDSEVVKAAPLPEIEGEFFRFAGGKGFQRPFELATLRLRNMVEVLGHWGTYVPDASHLTQRGATFLFDPQGQLLFEHRDRNLLGFSPTMQRPLSFLEDCLEPLSESAGDRAARI